MLRLHLYSFFKDTSAAPEIINPLLEKHNSASVVQSDKMFKFFSRPEIDMDGMKTLPGVSEYIEEHNLDEEIVQQTEIQVKYSGYIEKEKRNADKLNRLEGVRIPANFDYSKIQSLSAEAREKLNQIQPRTVSQASRISGITPNDVSVLLVYMGR